MHRMHGPVKQSAKLPDEVHDRQLGRIDDPGIESVEPLRKLLLCYAFCFCGAFPVAVLTVEEASVFVAVYAIGSGQHTSGEAAGVIVAVGCAAGALIDETALVIRPTRSSGTPFPSRSIRQ